MKVWISKYALSIGITDHECGEPIGGRVYPGSPFASFYGFSIGTDAHTTREEAIEVAEKMRIKKLASLEKQIAKLRAMKF